ncbi:MAG: DUF4339 domain-containing protein [Candidatus Nealsonbacteria bacterium]|nr:DUF4339 domain-containing protein [Candidatus Nealsonbacteria bacterium]
MSETLWFVISGDEEVGPFPRSHLQVLAEEGKIKSDTKLRRKDASRCVRAGAIVGVPAETAGEPGDGVSGEGVSGGRSTEASSLSASEAGNWIRVSTGLSVSLAALIFQLASSSILAVSAFRLTLPPEVEIGPNLVIFWGWCFCALGASVVMLWTGWFICAAVPRKTGAHPPITAAIGMSVAALVLSVVATLVYMGALAEASRDPWTPHVSAREMAAQNASVRIIGCLAQAAWIGGTMMFSLFLGCLGRFFEQNCLRHLATGLAVFELLRIIWFIVLCFLPEVGMTLCVITTALFLASTAWALCLVQLARDQIRICLWDGPLR